MKARIFFSLLILACLIGCTERAMVKSKIVYVYSIRSQTDKLTKKAVLANGDIVQVGATAKVGDPIQYIIKSYDGEGDIP